MNECSSTMYVAHCLGVSTVEEITVTPFLRLIDIPRALSEPGDSCGEYPEKSMHEMG